MSIKKLKKVSLKQWIKALRSRKYKQGREVLYKDGKYCCLGVYGKLCGLSNEVMGSNPYLSYISDMKIPSELKQKDLAFMNDGTSYYEKHSFKEIADVLEGKMNPKED